jgi:hypothetical protein
VVKDRLVFVNQLGAPLPRPAGRYDGIPQGELAAAGRAALGVGAVEALQIHYDFKPLWVGGMRIHGIPPLFFGVKKALRIG